MTVSIGKGKLWIAPAGTPFPVSSMEVFTHSPGATSCVCGCGLPTPENVLFASEGCQKEFYSRSPDEIDAALVAADHGSAIYVDEFGGFAMNASAWIAAGTITSSHMHFAMNVLQENERKRKPKTKIPGMKGTDMTYGPQKPKRRAH